MPIFIYSFAEEVMWCRARLLGPRENPETVGGVRGEGGRWRGWEGWRWKG